MPPTTKSVSAVILAAKGNLKQASINCENPEKLTFQEIHAYFRKKEEPNQQFSHAYNGKNVTFFGYSTGKGQKNTHALPAPHNEELFIGDILVILGNSWETPTNMKIKDWEELTAVTEDVAADDAEDLEDADAEEDADADAEAEEEVDVDDIEGAEDADDAEDVEIEGQEDLEEADDAEDIPKKKSSKKKLKLTTAFAKQQALLENDKFVEITPENYTQNRITLGLINSFFDTEGLSEEIQEKLEKAIFINAYNEAKRRHVISHWSNPLFKQLYKTTLMNIVSNLCPSSYVKNKGLFKKIKSGEFDISLLADFNCYDLYPEHWKELEDKRLMREQAHMEGNKGMATDQFKCNRCKKRECTSYEMQTRSSDEPMTLFITCMNCGKRWRQ